MKKPLISIVVPVYKVEEYLDVCIKSIVNQTYSNLEIILVDDGSPDKCPDICDKWAEEDARITVIHKVNGGPSDARNCGIEHSNGEYITFIDSDDVVSPDLVKNLVSVAVNITPCDIVSAEILRFQDNPPLNKFTQNCAIILEKKELCHVRHGYFTPAILFSRQHLLECRLRFDTRLKNLEDVIFNGIYLIYTNKVYYISDKLYYYRNTPNSITKGASDTLYQVKCWYSARNAISNWFAENKTTRRQIKEYRKLYRHCQNNLHAEAYVGNLAFEQIQQLCNDSQCIQLETAPPVSVFEKILLKTPRIYFKMYTLLFRFVKIIRK